jgi:hypothetical protein
MIATGPAGFVQRWVELYTRGLPAELRERRRTEIDADLWSQVEEARLIGRPARSTNTEIVARWLAGVPADLSWRLEHRGENVMGTSSQPMVMSPGALGPGLATVIAGLGLAAVYLLFLVSSRAIAPTNPYYVTWPGVVLVLGGALAQIVLAIALFAIVMHYAERLNRVVAIATGVGSLVAILAALGAYAWIVLVPLATALLAANLATARVIGGWLAAIHIVSAMAFGVVIRLLITPTAQGAAYPDGVFAMVLWPLTLAAVGYSIMRGERVRQAGVAAA